MSENIKFSKMEEKDLDELLKIGKKHWPNQDWLSKDYLKISFDQPGLNYVAKKDDKVIGGIILVLEDIAKNWIRYFIVDENYRRSGIGTRLLNKAIEHLKKGETIFVDTGIADKIAINFYEKNGFIKEGKVKRLYDNYKQGDAYILKKKI